MCIQCELAKLCPRCSLADIPLCKPCTGSQLQTVKNAEWQAHCQIPCGLCSSIYQTEKCSACKLHICQACDADVKKHKCKRCESLGCIGRRSRVCCDRCWCERCFHNHWARCPRTQFYICSGCKNNVLKFGDDADRCPRESCPRGWGCRYCAVRAGRGMVGLYCDYHILREMCPGCLVPRFAYPESGSIQNLRTREKWICCGRCVDRMAALVESVLIVWRRMQHRKMRDVMDVIVGFASNALVNTPK